MKVITKAEFIKLVNNQPENAALLTTESGFVTLCSELEYAGEDQNLRLNRMSFDLNWRNCESAEHELNTCRDKYSGGIEIIDCDSNTEIISLFLDCSDPYVKYAEINDDELEDFARRFPHDTVYIFLHKPIAPVKRKRTRKQKYENE